MNIKWQSVIFIILILGSLAFTKISSTSFLSMFSSSSDSPAAILDVSPGSSATGYESGWQFSATSSINKIPLRKWDVPDISINAQAVLMQSLDDNRPFLNYRTNKPWPIASITKLVTASVALETLGANQKIDVSQRAVDTEGTAGNLISGEVYRMEDLIKIMLITSSNDAVTAIEERFGGADELTRMLNKKAGELGMADTVFYDGSGLSDLDVSTASDLLKLVRYIIEEHPDILGWTRLPSILVQPLNSQAIKTLYNINPFVGSADFLGGKTGTLPEAKQNILGLFSFGDFRMAVAVLGADDRIKEVPRLFEWIKGAYEF